MTAQDRAMFHMKVLENLRTKRSQFEAQWEDSAWRLLPAHKDSFRSRSFSNAHTPGRANHEKSYDSTAALALQRFATVYESLTTPQGQFWHRLSPMDKRLKKHRQTAAYMDDVTDLLFEHRYRPAAGFVGQQQKMLLGFGAYGNGYMFTDAQDDLSGLRYKSIHLGECYVIEDHAGNITQMYRSYWMTIEQAAAEFGKDNLPEAWRKRLDSPQQKEEEKEFLHVIAPREFYNPNRVDALGMPFESMTFAVETKTVLRESGYQNFPLSMARYIQFANETYGRGPAQTVLPAIKVLNEEKKTVIKQGHRVVDPVLLAHDDGMVGTFSLRSGAINPGGVNSQGRPLVHALPTGNIVVGKELMDDERAVINDAFLVTLFQILVETPTMTATEVLERTREKGMLLAPTAGRLQQEYLGPMIERELEVLARLGLLPSPPEALLASGGGYKIEYDNPMSRMAEAEKAAGYMRSMETALSIAQTTGDVSVMDWFDNDAAMPEIQSINGAPVRWTRTMEAVGQIRAKREQEMQDQKAIQAAPAMAALAKVETDNRNK